MSESIQKTTTGAIVRGEFWAIGSGGAGGGKGGGGGGRTPQETPNSLRSRDIASVLFLIGEGEIEGFPNGDILRNTYLDEVPIQNADGSLNFKDVQVEFRPGTQNQSYIPGFSDVEAEEQVGVKVSQVLGSVVRTLTDPNADAISIRLMTPQLQTIDEKSGDVRGGRIDFRIEVAIAGQGYQTYVQAAIEGKCTSPYARSYRIPLPKPATSWQIRVTRLTADSNSTRISDELYWQSYKTIIEAKLSYPNSALFGIRLNAEQFRQIPKVSVRLRGLKYAIPSNYNPVTRTYTGIWNRTFSYAYTNNPAWVFYDLVTENRYGCGKYIDASQIDIDALYAIAQYCDELVPDGFGGWEPRFVCNAYINSQEEAYNVLNTLAGVFRGMTYWAGGEVTAVQDRPSAPVRLYTEAGVIQEKDEQGQITTPPFSYAGTSRKARHTVALVSYSDPNDFYRPKIEYVEDRDGIAKYGYRETQVVAFGCTSRGQAQRVGRWLLYTERLETETVTFTVGSIGAIALPGDIIQTSDPSRAGSVQWGGRIIAATTTQITLDRPVVLEVGKTYTLRVYKSDDGTIETRNVTTGAGSQTILTVSPAFTIAPVISSEWLLAANDLQPETWRVLTVTEKAPHQYTITALEHNSSKYNAIEYGFALEQQTITRLPNLLQQPQPPGSITIAESLYESGAAGIRTKVDITFAASPSPGIERYQIEYKAVDDPAGFTVLGTADPLNLNLNWQNVQAGIYTFRAIAINQIGLRSAPVEITRQISGLQAPPKDVSNFTLTRSGSNALLQWDQHPDIDVQKGGYFKIKFTPKTSSVSWSDGFDLPIVAGSSNTAIFPLAQGTYMIKAFDSTDNESVNAALTSSNWAIAQSTNIVQSRIEHPAFPGDKFRCVVNSGTLQLAPMTLFDSQNGLFDEMVGLFDSVQTTTTFDSTQGLFDSQPGYFDNTNAVTEIVTDGIYEFSSPIDLGSVFICQISANLSTTISSNRNLFDGREGLFDSQPGLFDGGDISGAAAVLQIAVSQDGITFADWANFTIGEYVGRTFKFRLVMSTESQNTNILIDALSVVVDMPDRDESGRATSDGSVQTISFARSFWTTSVPVAGVSLIDQANGDYFVLSNITNSSFQIQVFNAAGTAISGRSFNWLARGFGQAN